MGDSALKAPVFLVEFHARTQAVPLRVGMHPQTVRMLRCGIAGGKGKEEGQHLATVKRARDQPALVLDRHHQVGIVGRIVLAPDAPLEILSRLHLGERGKVAQNEVGHAVQTSTSSDTVSR